MSGRPTPRAGLSHLTTELPTHDLAATRDFYVRDLGLAVEREDATRLLLRVGDARLEFVQHDGVTPGSGGPVLAFACADPPALLVRLRAFGVEVELPPSRAGSAPVRRFAARDPDGRAVVFRTDARGAD